MAAPSKSAQTRDKLAGENVRRQAEAISTHEQLGREVRGAIRRIGGVLPEDIAPDEHIRTVEKRLKSTPPKLELAAPDAGGLVGGPSRRHPG